MITRTTAGPSVYEAPVIVADYAIPVQSIEISTTAMPTYQEYKAIQAANDSVLIKAVQAAAINEDGVKIYQVPILASTKIAEQGSVKQEGIGVANQISVLPASESNIKYVLYGLVGLVAILVVKKYFNK